MNEETSAPEHRLAPPPVTTDVCPKPTRSMVGRRIFFWIGISSISAAPSLGVTIRDPDDFPLSALILGILTFAVAAGVLSSQRWVQKLTRHPRLRRAILTAYIIRTIFAAIPLAPMLIDMWVGMIAMMTGGLFILPFSAIADSPPIEATAFISTYILVLWQGFWLNLVVWVLVLLAWLFQRLFMQPPADRTNGSCPRCQYDLRSTIPGHPCPECGELKILRCADCGQDLPTGAASTPCPSCGSTRKTTDPRWQSWVSRISLKGLTVFVLACIFWSTIMALINSRFL